MQLQLTPHFSKHQLLVVAPSPPLLSSNHSFTGGCRELFCRRHSNTQVKQVSKGSYHEKKEKKFILERVERVLEGLLFFEKSHFQSSLFSIFTMIVMIKNIFLINSNHDTSSFLSLQGFFQDFPSLEGSRKLPNSRNVTFNFVIYFTCILFRLVAIIRERRDVCHYLRILSLTRIILAFPSVLMRWSSLSDPSQSHPSIEVHPSTTSHISASISLLRPGFMTCHVILDRLGKILQ